MFGSVFGPFLAGRSVELLNAAVVVIQMSEPVWGSETASRNRPRSPATGRSRNSGRSPHRGAYRATGPMGRSARNRPGSHRLSPACRRGYGGTRYPRYGPRESFGLGGRRWAHGVVSRIDPTRLLGFHRRVPSFRPTFAESLVVIPHDASSDGKNGAGKVLLGTERMTVKWVLAGEQAEKTDS